MKVYLYWFINFICRSLKFFSLLMLIQYLMVLGLSHFVVVYSDIDYLISIINDIKDLYISISFYIKLSLLLYILYVVAVAVKGIIVFNLNKDDRKEVGEGRCVLDGLKEMYDELRKSIRKKDILQK